MKTQTNNTCLQYYILCWAEESIKIDSRNSVFNIDLMKSCNDYIRKHLKYLGARPADSEIFVHVKTIRSCLKHYIKEKNLSNTVKFRYHNHVHKGIKGIRLASTIEQEEALLKNIRLRISEDLQHFYSRGTMPPYTFTKPYRTPYYQELKQTIAQLPNYFFPLFQLHQRVWEDTYRDELNRLKTRSKSRWYQQQHKYENLFPRSYGINPTYPRYKIYPTYGTVMSIPHEFRQNILEKLNKLGSYGKFYTLDFTACHLNILVGLFQKHAPSCHQLLRNNVFWTTIINQIVTECNTVFRPHITEELNKTHLKTILKKFVYKKLQGGDITNTKDIHENLSPDLRKLLGHHFDEIAESIQKNTYIQEISHITDKVASEKIIYTPEYPDGYSIRIKRQRISRVATGIEICLLLHATLTIFQLSENLIPISLEHDGLLLYGKCDNIEKYIQKVNLEISKHSKQLIKHPITIELKA